MDDEEDTKGIVHFLVLDELFRTLSEIKENYTKGDYSRARDLQKLFLRIVETRRMQIREQSNRMGKLLKEYLELSGGIVSI